MDKTDTLKIKQLIKRLAHKYKLDEKTVKEIVESPYEFMNLKLREIDLDKEMSEDEVNSLKTDFNLKGLGKFYLCQRSFKARKSRQLNASIINKSKWKN